MGQVLCLMETILIKSLEGNMQTPFLQGLAYITCRLPHSLGKGRLQSGKLSLNQKTPRAAVIPALHPTRGVRRREARGRKTLTPIRQIQRGVPQLDGHASLKP